MKRKSKLILPFASAALVVTAGCLFLYACQKDAASKTALQSISACAANNAAAALEFDSAMYTMAKESLVAWYSFGSGSLKDRSKHHNDITFSNAMPVADRFGREGYAYHFDGNSSYMRIPNSKSLNPTEEITLFAIIKVEDFYGGPCHGNRFVCKGSDDYKKGHYFLGFDDSYHTNGQNCSQEVKKKQENFNAFYGNARSGRTSGAYDTGFVQKNKWYRIAYTYANGISKLFVNGRILSYSDQSPVFIDNKEDLFLGRMGNPQYPYWFNGILDEVAIFNKALSEEEVASLSKL